MKLQPGVYLIGRRDGNMNPFFVVVVSDGSLVQHHPDRNEVMAEALSNEEKATATLNVGGTMRTRTFWWDLMVVPDEMPLSFAEFGRPDEEGGK